MLRKSIVSGQFYPDDKKELEKKVREYLGKKKKQDIKACIVPHAGYVFSGKLAGEVLGRIEDKKNFIILGVNHSGIGSKLSFSLTDFEMPFGIVKNNKILGEKLMNILKKEIDAEINEEAHKHEHSIEVELPFLHFSQKNFSIVPVLLKDLSYEECRKTAEILSNLINNETCLIVSSDFTHYGRNYGFLPFNSDIKENLYKLDLGIIDSIVNLNSKEVYEKASKSTVCGIFGLTILTEIAKIKKYKVKKIGYCTSGAVSGEWSSVVGYGGIIFL